MRRLLTFISGTVYMCLLFAMQSCGGQDEGGETAADAGDGAGNVAAMHENPVERGEYLVTVMGCNDCHSSKVPGPNGMPAVDSSMLLAGHPAGQALPGYDEGMIGMGPDKWILANMSFTAYVGPWGTSYAANLTPDPTGIGAWSAEQFKKAMREGKFKGMDGTRPLLPPMPWTAYRHLPEEDLDAIFAYLQSIPAVENVVPAADIKMPMGGPGETAGAHEGAPDAEEAAAGA